MSKLGVGVGEDFPLDGEQARPGAEDFHRCEEEWEKRRDQAFRSWRRMRSQMSADWRARRREMHRHFTEQEPVEPMDGARMPQLHHLVIGGLALLGLAALFGLHRK
jgi:hypothetical protein